MVKILKFRIRILLKILKNFGKNKCNIFVILFIISLGRIFYNIVFIINDSTNFEKNKEVDENFRNQLNKDYENLFGELN